MFGTNDSPLVASPEQTHTGYHTPLDFCQELCYCVYRCHHIP